MTQMVYHSSQKFKVSMVIGVGGGTDSSKIKILYLFFLNLEFIGKLDGWMDGYVHTYIILKRE